MQVGRFDAADLDDDFVLKVRWRSTPSGRLGAAHHGYRRIEVSFHIDDWQGIRRRLSPNREAVLGQDTVVIILFADPLPRELAGDSLIHEELCQRRSRKGIVLLRIEHEAAGRKAVVGLRMTIEVEEEKA